jgi:hypothetical protein
MPILYLFVLHGKWLIYAKILDAGQTIESDKEDGCGVQ